MIYESADVNAASVFHNEELPFFNDDREAVIEDLEVNMSQEIVFKTDVYLICVHYYYFQILNLPNLPEDVPSQGESVIEHILSQIKSEFLPE